MQTGNLFISKMFICIRAAEGVQVSKVPGMGEIEGALSFHFIVLNHRIVVHSLSNS